jgi:curved DNA-binding protein CbpA
MTSSGDSKFTDYYDLLGIQPSADIGQIRNAFIQQAKLHHPDAGGSEAIMQQLNLAYKTLMSPTAKATYDMLHNFHTGETQPGDYKYQDGREVNGVTDMNDDEIDSFLDSLFAEYRHGPPEPTEPRPTVKQRVKRLFDI